MWVPRVEQQAELSVGRERFFELVSTADGLARWLDEVDVAGGDAVVGARVRFRLREAFVEGSVVALDAPQHVSFSWDYPADPLPAPTVVAFDAIDHGTRSHVTVRHVGFRSRRQVDLHDALWRYWFERLRVAAEAAERAGGAGGS
ncbi:MAG: SRPBCC domain-containing protein [Candidatus Limnocylindrales bacterium]